MHLQADTLPALSLPPAALPRPAPSAAVRRLLLEALTDFLGGAAEERELSIAEWRVGEHARRRGRTAGAGSGSDQAKATAKGQGMNKGRAKAATDLDMATTANAANAALSMDIDSATQQPTASTSTATALPSAPSATATATAAAPASGPHPPVARPALLSHLAIGINDCTRALESRIRWGRWELGDPSASPPAPVPAYGGAPALRRGHKRRHRSARAAGVAGSAAAEELDGQAGESEERPVPAVPSLGDASEATGPSSYLLPPPDGGTGPVLLRPNHEQIRPAKPRLPSASPADGHPAGLPIVDLVFVCRPDINPPALVAHLPTMAAAANGVRQALQEAQVGASETAAGTEDGMEVDVGNTEGGAPGTVSGNVARPLAGSVYLVPLDVGAEHALAATLALRRVAAVGISVSSQLGQHPAHTLPHADLSLTLTRSPSLKRPTSPASSPSWRSTSPLSKPPGLYPTSRTPSPARPRPPPLPLQFLRSTRSFQRTSSTSARPPRSTPAPPSSPRRMPRWPRGPPSGARARPRRSTWPRTDVHVQPFARGGVCNPCCHCMHRQIPFRLRSRVSRQRGQRDGLVGVNNEREGRVHAGVVGRRDDQVASRAGLEPEQAGHNARRRV